MLLKAMGLDISPSSLSQVANQKVTKTVSTKCPHRQHLLTQAPHGPQEVRLELTLGSYVAMHCLVADRSCLQLGLLIKAVSDLFCRPSGGSLLLGLPVLIVQSFAILVCGTPGKKRCLKALPLPVDSLVRKSQNCLG